MEPPTDPRFAEAVLEAARHSGLGVVVARLTPEFEVVYVSPRTEEIVGRSAEEIAGAPLEIFAPRGLAVATEDLEARRRGETPPPGFSTTIARADGVEIPVDFAIGMKDIDGVLHGVAFIRDNSAMEASQRTLQQSEARLRTLIEATPNGIVVVRRRKIAFLNPAASQLLRVKAGESILGRPLEEVLHPDDFDEMIERTDTLEPGGRAQGPHEYRVRTATGDALVVEVTTARFDDDDGPAVVGFVRDVTEARSLQAQLMRADRLAALGTMAAGVAHEINNPLAFMLLGLDSIERKLDRGEQERDAIRATLADIRHGVDRVSGIIKQLRTFSRAETTVSTSTRDVAEAVRAAARMVSHEIRHYGRLELDLADRLPAVKGAEAQLEQVFINLLLNAAQALDVQGGNGRVAVTARATGGGVEIVVTDDGRGISAADLARIFDPFYTTKAVGSGTGLGLSICHSIVSALGGVVRIDSELGSGTTATVFLPLATRGQSSRAARRSTPSPEHSGPRFVVLAVDDEPAFLRALERILAPAHDIETAIDAEEAWKRIEDREPDVILLDVMMPMLSGMDFYERIADERPELIERVIMMTGGSARPEVERFLSRVKRPILRKPFDEQRIFNALRKISPTQISPTT